MCWRNYENMLSRYHRILERDEQTNEWQTDRTATSILHISEMTRDKHIANFVIWFTVSVWWRAIKVIYCSRDTNLVATVKILHLCLVSCWVTVLFVCFLCYTHLPLFCYTTVYVAKRPFYCVQARLLVWAVHASRSSRWTTASPFSQP